MLLTKIYLYLYIYAMWTFDLIKFVFEKINKTLKSKAETPTTESTREKLFWHQKRDCVSPIFKHKGQNWEKQNLFKALWRTLHHDNTVLEHPKNGIICRCITHGSVLNLLHDDNFLHIVEQHCVQNDQLNSPDYGLVSSVVFIWLLFVYVSPSVVFHQSHSPSSLFKPRRHLLSKNLFPLQNIARVHPRRPGDLANSFFSIVGLVLRPSHVGNTLEPCMAVTHVLFVDDESRGDSIFQFACFLFHVIELSFPNFWCF